MATGTDRTARRRVASSSISTVVSMALVLFMLGCLTLILINSQKLSTYVKENIRFQVYLKKNTRKVDIIKLKKILDAEEFTRSTRYISKKEAAKTLKKDLGEDFIKFLGYNPLPPSIDLDLKAEYAHPDSISWIEDELLQNPNVKEVAYPPDLIREVNRNVEKITLVMLSFSALLMVVAIALINNTIRLSIYSKRFLIRSMQLVGATRGFIQRPFLIKGLLQGLYASFIAILMITGVIYFVREQFSAFFEVQDIRSFALLFGIVILLGLLISGISTWLAVKKYLRLKPEKLF
ncbi:MAG: cell division protein FtsX [Flavobacteriales bacterium]